MSPKESKPRYRIVYRTHYPIPDWSDIDEKRAAIAQKSITEKYKKFGIFLNLDEATFIR